MTTFTLNGVLQVWVDTNRDSIENLATFSAITADIATPQNSTFFSYQPLYGHLVDIEGNFYYANLPGPLRFNFDFETVEIFHLDAAAGFSADILKLDVGENISAYFSIRGDAYPVFTSHDEFEAFQASATFGTVAPDVASGVQIEFGSFTGATVTEVDRLLGTRDPETFFGGRGNDIIKGGRGNDHLVGGDDRDRISGGEGNDHLNGGRGDDVMDGGLGWDVFLFQSDCGDDRIFKFQDNVDTIVLDDALWGGDLTVDQVVETYAAVINGAVVLDFGENSIRISGLSDVVQLLDDVTII